MIIALSILSGVVVAGVSYRILFYDLSDFLDGLIKFFTAFLVRRRRWPFERIKSPGPDESEDDGWSNGIRFFIFLALSGGAGYFAHSGLHRYFGP